MTDAGDGVVLLTSRDVDAGAMKDSPPGGPANLEAMAGNAHGSVRVAYLKPAAGGCGPTAFGGWETRLGRAAELRLRVAGTPDPGAFRPPVVRRHGRRRGHARRPRALRDPVRAQEQRHDAAAAVDHRDTGLRAALSLPALEPFRSGLGTTKPPPWRGLRSIGAPRFELGTSPTRTVRATRLRHAPRPVESSCR